jgi:hypothetical protein
MLHYFGEVDVDVVLFGLFLVSRDEVLFFEGHEIFAGGFQIEKLVGESV